MIKKLFKKNFLNLIKLSPFTLRKKLASFFASTLKKSDGLNEIGGFLEFSALKCLSDDDEYLKLYRKSIIKANDQNTDNIYKIFRHLNLYNYIENVLLKNIDGDFAECGCWNGNSLFATKALIDKYSSSKNIHVFDSFEGGLSEFNKEDFKDFNVITDQKVKNIQNFFASSYDELSIKTKSLTRINLNKGWIPDIFLSQEERNYSFVHIDVDLYKPTFDSHKYFFQRLSKGGIIVCDDYGYDQFPGASLAVDEFISSISKDSYSYFFKHPFGTSVIIK